jgi:3-methyladenine DNA glycosylase AlkD
MTKQEVLQDLEGYGNDQTKKTLMNHGAKEPLFGVKVADLKKVLKKTKKNHDLSLELYATGNSDAMYLAALMADESQITKDQINQWVGQAYWAYLNEFAVPWVASETDFGYEIGLEWIESEDEDIATAGWATLYWYTAVNEDEKLNLQGYNSLLDRVESTIHDQPNRVRHTMNAFVIAVGGYVGPLTDRCLEVAINVGKVSVEMNGTACKVPFAHGYIMKIVNRGSVGKKRKSARC